MAKREFKLVKNIETHFDSVQHGKTDAEVEIKWEDCFICQEDSNEKLVCRSNKKRSLDLHEQYSKTVTTDALRILNRYPCHWQTYCKNLKSKCVDNKAVYHKRCRNQYNYPHYERAKNRTKTSDDKNDTYSSTKTRSHFEAKNLQEICFLGNESTKEALCRVRTFQVDKRVRYSAQRLLDETLISE